MNNKKSGSGGLFLNLLTSLFMLGSILLLAYFGYTFANPYHALNPFQPTAVAQPAAKEMPTAIPTDESLTDSTPPTEAPTLLPPTATLVPLPSDTPMSFPTATPVVINTPADTPTSEPISKFVAQEGTPSYLPHSGGCSGLYIAGNITDIDHNPVMLMTVRAEGVLGDEGIFIEVLSGSNTDYTVSGWEIKLSDSLIASTGEITLSLYVQGGWEPISEVVLVDTFDECSRNLAVVNFIQE